MAAENDSSYSGRLKGFIRPPPDIRVVVDKTAAFVAAHGADYEKRILESSGTTAKFGFLKPDNPYHAYYRHKIAEAKGEVPASSAEAAPSESKDRTGERSTPAIPHEESNKSSQQVEDGQSAVVVKRAAGLVNPLAKALKAVGERVANITTDGKFCVKDEYSVAASPLYTAPGTQAINLDTLKLTAQFTAVNGKSFLSALTQREFRNPMFEFLKPGHVYFPYFTGLVEAYNKVISPSTQATERLANSISSIDGILEQCVTRMEAARISEERRAEDDKVRTATGSALVDWQDFMVVETITFADDEDKDLPAPQTVPSTLRSNDSIRTTVVNDGERMNIRTDYVPQPSSAPASHSLAAFVDPRTGREIPVERATEQMRVELMDPRWKQQQQTYQSRHSETALVGGDEVAENLKRLAARRVDIFADRDGQPAAKKPRRDDEAAPGT